MPASDVLDAATVAELRALTIDLAYPDTCELRREASAGVDEFGNALPSTTNTVASTACALREGGLQPNEREVASRLGWETPYAIDLPYDTLATTADTIRVNGGRIFHIGGVVKEGLWGMQATAIVEERG